MQKKEKRGGGLGSDELQHPIFILADSVLRPLTGSTALNRCSGPFTFLFSIQSGTSVEVASDRRAFLSGLLNNISIYHSLYFYLMKYFSLLVQHKHHLKLFLCMFLERHTSRAECNLQPLNVCCFCCREARPTTAHPVLQADCTLRLNNQSTVVNKCTSYSLWYMFLFPSQQSSLEIFTGAADDMLANQCN